MRAMVSWWKKLFVLAAAVLIFLQSGIMGSLVVGIVAAYKDTYVKSSGTLFDGDNHVVSVRSAEISLPLIWPPCSTPSGSPPPTP